MSRPLLKSTTTTGFATLLSRITGLARETAMAASFGAGPLTDAFLAAYKIPNFLRRLFAEGAFSQSFVPVISEYKAQRSQGEVRELVGAAAGTLGAALFVLSLIGVLVAPVIILIYAPGFTAVPGKFEMAVQMLRWTFPYLLFISLTSLCAGVLNSYGRFFVPAMTQVVGNLAMIGSVFIAAGSEHPAQFLAMGVLASGVVQLVFQLPSVAKLGLLSPPRWAPALDGVRRIAKLMVPGIIGSSMAQISLLLDTIIVSFLVTGSMTWLYYADRLMEFPLGVFSIALATVILPGLSANHATKSTAQFSATLDWALRLVLLLATPAAVGMLCFAGPMTAMILGYGRFDAPTVQLTSVALMAYSWGLLGFSLVKVLVPGYYARQNTKQPVRIAMTALAVTMSLNAMVLFLVKVVDVPVPYPHTLIATSTCIGAAVNTWLLWRGLLREGVLQHSPGWRMFLLRLLVANAVMGALLWWLSGDTLVWAQMPALERLGRGAGGIVLGAAVYFATLFAIGMRQKHLRSAAA
jgi:putative peptidoglycan lipid II flippase